SVAGGEIYQSQAVVNVIYALIALGVLWPFARLGHWRALAAARLGKGAGSPGKGTGAAPPAPSAPPDAPTPDQWPELRAAGRPARAGALSAAVRLGRVDDVGGARVRPAWSGGRAHPERLAALSEAVLRSGGAAALHPPGAGPRRRRSAA